MLVTFRKSGGGRQNERLRRTKAGEERNKKLGNGREAEGWRHLQGGRKRKVL